MMPPEIVDGGKKMRIGLEIHQQVDSGKLFCRCPSVLTEDEGVKVTRRLRPVAGEAGGVDNAAAFEARRNFEFVYEAPPSTCPVELDEEPPRPADGEALRTALTIALLVGAEIPPEIHFMRKIVIDGSNTTGFQRTAIIGMNGALEVNGKLIPVTSVCLEEDAARRISESDGRVVYRLDRQGIPLIEIATGPEISTPEEAGAAAKSIGSLFRSTRKVKRGLGTIREDLNISIPGGARVEIKGVQDLHMIPDYVRNEADRQRDLLSVREILASRDASVGSTVEVTARFISTKSPVLKRAMENGGVVLAVAMPGFAGTFGEKHSSRPGKRVLGPELADWAKLAGLGGLFHSDELPSYGMTAEETVSLASFLGCGISDGFLLVAGPRLKCERAMEGITVRARQALKGVPEETREPLPEGETSYARPLPGGARMYPETDVPTIKIEPELIDALRKNLPESLEKMAKRLASEYGIHPQQAAQIVREELDAVFEAGASKDKRLLGPIAARAILSTSSELEKDGIDPRLLREPAFLSELLGLVADGLVAKEGVGAVAKHAIIEGKSPSAVAKERGLKAMDDAEIRRLLDELVSKNADIVRAKGKGASAC